MAAAPQLHAGDRTWLPACRSTLCVLSPWLAQIEGAASLHLLWAGGGCFTAGELIEGWTNGQLLHENVEMKNATPGGVDGKEKPKGPLMFQGNHGPVAYRNIVVKPLK